MSITSSNSPERTERALTAGVTARIFRLIETAAEQAILSGKERLDLQSFGDDLTCRSCR